MEVYSVPAKLRPGALGTGPSFVAKHESAVSLIVSPRKREGKERAGLGKKRGYQTRHVPDVWRPGLSLTTSIHIITALTTSTMLYLK
jgi:hypothetical protein